MTAITTALPAEALAARRLPGYLAIWAFILAEMLAFAAGGTPLIDVALTLALLAAISGIAFAQRTWQKKEEDDDLA